MLKIIHERNRQVVVSKHCAAVRCVEPSALLFTHDRCFHSKLRRPRRNHDQ